MVSPPVPVDNPDDRHPAGGDRTVADIDIWWADLKGVGGGVYPDMNGTSKGGKDV